MVARLLLHTRGTVLCVSRAPWWGVVPLSNRVYTIMAKYANEMLGPSALSALGVEQHYVPDPRANKTADSHAEFKPDHVRTDPKPNHPSFYRGGTTTTIWRDHRPLHGQPLLLERGVLHVDAGVPSRL